MKENNTKIQINEPIRRNKNTVNPINNTTNKSLSVNGYFNIFLIIFLMPMLRIPYKHQL